MKKVLTIFVLLGMVLMFITSCRTSGYGCKGRESWGGLMKRINKPY
jgi:hypothetical protein